MPDPSANRLQLSLKNGSTYEAGKDAGDYHISEYSGQGDQALYAEKPQGRDRFPGPSIEMDTRPLYRTGVSHAGRSTRPRSSTRRLN